MAKSGAEYAIEFAINKLLEHMPPEVIDNIKQIGQTVAGFKAQLDRIEARLERLENARFDANRNSGIIEQPKSNGASTE
jgi:hypothetical protein